MIGLCVIRYIHVLLAVSFTYINNSSVGTAQNGSDHKENANLHDELFSDDDFITLEGKVCQTPCLMMSRIGVE